MLFYLIVIIASSSLATIAEITKYKNILLTNFFIFCSALVMLVPLAMRGMGVDYDQYELSYNIISLYPFSDYWTLYLGRPEPLYVLMNYTAYWILGDFQGVNILCAILSIGFTFCGLYRFKNYINIGLSVWIIGFLYYIMMYGLNRMMIAVSIIGWAYSYCINRNTKKFIMWCIIAGGFHYSALLMIPFYFIIWWINNNKIYKQVIAYTAVAFIFIGIYHIVPQLFGQFIWFDRYIIYFDLGINIEALNNNAIIYIFIPFFTLYSMAMNRAFGDVYTVLSSTFKVFLVISLISIFMPIHRVGYLFYPEIAILYSMIPRAMVGLKNKGVNKYALFYYGLMLIGGILWIYHFLEMGTLWAPFLNPYELSNYFS